MYPRKPSYIGRGVTEAELCGRPALQLFADTNSSAYMCLLSFKLRFQVTLRGC